MGEKFKQRSQSYHSSRAWLLCLNIGPEHGAGSLCTKAGCRFENLTRLHTGKGPSYHFFCTAACDCQFRRGGNCLPGTNEASLAESVIKEEDACLLFQVQSVPNETVIPFQKQDLPCAFELHEGGYKHEQPASSSVFMLTVWKDAASIILLHLFQCQVFPGGSLLPSTSDDRESCGFSGLML